MMYSLFPTPVFHENQKHLCDRFNSSQNDFKIVSDTLLDKGFELIKRMGLKTNYNNLKIKDIWLETFKEYSNQEYHVHYNSLVSGFLFLEVGKDTSFPIFCDPRSNTLLYKDINELENKDEVSAMSERVNIKPQQGDLIIFPSYLPHMFTVQKNNNILRFIHFNLHDKL